MQSRSEERQHAEFRAENVMGFNGCFYGHRFWSHRNVQTACNIVDTGNSVFESLLYEIDLSTGTATPLGPDMERINNAGQFDDIGSLTALDVVFAGAMTKAH